MTLFPGRALQDDGDRSQDFRAWRFNLGHGAVCDVDQIEYRVVNGVVRPVAVIELCGADMQSDEHPGGVRPGQDPSPAFFAACLDKVSPERLQGKLLRLLASRLEVPLILVMYIVGHLERGLWVSIDGKFFHDKDGKPHRWRPMTLEQYEGFLKKLTA